MPLNPITRRLHEDWLWATVLRRCGLLKHPSNLKRRDRKLQFLLLSHLSANPNDLPICRERWNEWYLWHEDNGTRLPTLR